MLRSVLLTGSFAAVPLSPCALPCHTGLVFSLRPVDPARVPGLIAQSNRRHFSFERQACRSVQRSELNGGTNM